MTCVLARIECDGQALIVMTRHVVMMRRFSLEVWRHLRPGRHLSQKRALMVALAPWNFGACSISS